MGKIYIVGLALVAVFVFSSVVVASASAETVLLAEWLFDGNPVVGTRPVQETVESLLEDNKVPIVGKVMVDCSYIEDGWVDANGLRFMSEKLSLGGIKINVLTGTGLLCTNSTGCEAATEASPIEVWPSSIGVVGYLYLMEDGEFLEHSASPGFQMLCLLLGAMVEDECNATETGFRVQNGTVPNGAETPVGSVAEPLATCKEGGANSGVTETITGAAKIIPTEGGELTVSSEDAGR